MKHIGLSYRIFDALGSTNDHAAGLLADAGVAGTVIRARCQTAGRGTHGRSWSSPPNAGVYLSIILDPPPALRRAPILTAWATVSVAEAIREMTGRQPRLKWPNDVLLGRKKISGILIEQKSYLIIGLGLNVNQSVQEFTAAGLPDATSLTIVADRSFDVDEVAATVLARLDDEYDSLLHGELAVLEACWKWRLGLLGRNVELEQVDGSRCYGRLVELSFTTASLQMQAGAIEHISPEKIRQLRQLSANSGGGSTDSSACNSP